MIGQYVQWHGASIVPGVLSQHRYHTDFADTE